VIGWRRRVLRLIFRYFTEGLFHVGVAMGYASPLIVWRPKAVAEDPGAAPPTYVPGAPLTPAEQMTWGELIRPLRADVRSDGE
jgi:hypothetical protein